MKTHVIQDEPAAGGGPVTIESPASPPGRSAPPQRSGSPGAGRVALVVLGSLGALVALALLVSGVAALVALGERDGDGYFMSDAHGLSSPANAIVTERLDIDADAPDWVFGEDLATTRIQARSSRPVFVGIGPSADVERYLADVRHTEITDLDTDPFRVTSRLLPGSASPAAPAGQSFWRVQASGAGAQAVTWPVESGQWSAVVMNADGSPGVDVQARFGARVPSLRWVAWGLLAGGLVALLISAVLLRLGTRAARP
jgi:hypothetical protein